MNGENNLIREKSDDLYDVIDTDRYYVERRKYISFKCNTDNIKCQVLCGEKKTNTVSLQKQVN